MLDGDGGDICGGGVYMEGIGELGFRVRAAGDRVDERTFRPWAVAVWWAGPWAVFSVGHQKKGVGCVSRTGLYH